MTSNKFSRRIFLKLAAATGIAVGTGSLVFGDAFSPYVIDVTDHRIPLRNLSSNFDGYKIIQITDLHMGSWLNRERLLEVVELVNELQPDLVAITGDFIVKGEIESQADNLIFALSQLQAMDGVVGVLGNHDYVANVERTREVLQQANVLELPNEHIIIERDSAKLVIAGLDDVWADQHDIAKLTSQIPEGLPVVLMAHEPDIADKTSRTGRFGLQISGHSHGGQIRTSDGNAPVLPWLGEKYSIGRYQVKDMIQYTNRGIGMTGIPIRINCPPEISIFNLEPLTT